MANPSIPHSAIVVALSDPVGEAVGFGPNSEYFSVCYLPVLGPASWLVYRHLAPLVGAADRTEVDLSDLARQLGLPPRLGRNAPLAQAMVRLEEFGLAQRRGDEYAVRPAAPPLSNARASRLPASARAAHFRLTGGHP